MRRHAALLALLGLATLAVGWLALRTRSHGADAHAEDPTSPRGIADARLDSAAPPLEIADPGIEAQQGSTSRTTPETALASRDPDGDATAPPDDEGCTLDPTATQSPGAPRVAGAIRGVLVREGGAWTSETLPAPNTVLLDLVSASHPERPALRPEFLRTNAADGTFEWSFEFADVPEGEYVLTLSALGSLRWSPTTLRVRAPQAGLVFTRYDGDRVETLGFDVLDAESGERIAGFDARHIQVTVNAESGVFLHTGPLDLAALPLDARFQWSISSPGYATAFGDETAFVRDGERRVATVRLTRGWSTKYFVLVRDPVARPAAGAEIVQDGARIGFTGADGMLVSSGAGAPARVEVHFAGFHVPADGTRAGGQYSAGQRGGVSVVMLDRDS